MDKIDFETAWGLSIDPNTKVTGLVEWRGRKALNSWILERDGWLEMEHALRHHIIFEPQIDWLACEGVFLGPNARVHAELSRLVGCIEGNCHWHGIAYLEGTTDEINAAIGLPPRTPSAKRKAAIRRLAVPHLRHTKPDDETAITEHECDAWAVGRWALRQLEREGLKRGE